MAITTIENFDSLNDGRLSGQNGWSGNIDFVVQTSTVFSGSKAASIYNNGSNTKVTKSLTEYYGVFTISLRRDRNNQDSGGFYLTHTGGMAFYVCLISKGKIVFGRRWGETELGSYSANTWYTVQLEVRESDKKARARIKDGAWTDWFEPNDSYSTALMATLRQDSTTYSKTFFDDLTFGVEDTNSNFLLLF